MKKKFRANILGAEKNGKYWASGVSVVAHMQNPRIPALHFNTRFYCNKQKLVWWWFDATPCIKDKKEEKMFHSKIKKICMENQKNYQRYKKWCDNYFLLTSPKSAKGIGGYFFDYETGDWFKNFKFVRDLGFAFIEISKKIILKKK